MSGKWEEYRPTFICEHIRHIPYLLNFVIVLNVLLFANTGKGVVSLKERYTKLDSKVFHNVASLDKYVNEVDISLVDLAPIALKWIYTDYV